MGTAADDDLSTLLRRHADLESRYGDGDAGRFLSGWQCDNPWAEQIREAVELQSKQINSGEYQYVDNDAEVKQKLVRFHTIVDGITPQALLCGGGSSSIIFMFCAWLRHHKIEEIYYIPPLYFSAHFALQILGIRARPISAKHAFESEFKVNLPDGRSVLFLCDPVWYAGTPLSSELIQSLIDWQRQTQSFVFIDGSFQYAGWEGLQKEASAGFDSDRTVRLLCPTKSLAIHGYRFSYALIPAELHAECTHIYNSTYGSSSIDTLAFAKAAPELIAAGRIMQDLMSIASGRHRLLRSRGTIAAPWQPRCGYFVFEQLTVEPPGDTPLMDGQYFEQRRYPTYRRINLLSPSLHLLD